VALQGATITRRSAKPKCVSAAAPGRDHGTDRTWDEPPPTDGAAAVGHGPAGSAEVGTGAESGGAALDGGALTY
jgi:hypothetical protein